MVGRLIQNEEVCLLHHQLCQRQAHLLTAGKDIDLFEDFISGKQEGTQNRTDLEHVKIGMFVPEFLQNRIAVMEVGQILIEVADLDLVTQHHIATQRFCFADDRFQ